MGTSEIVLERVQALLKIDTGSGSLHDHLVSLSRTLAEQKPGEALAQLETLSRNLKQSSFRGVSAPDQSLPIVVDSAAEEARLKWCDEIFKLVKQPSDPTAAPKVLGYVQDFLKDNAMFTWAGVGFSKQESYHVAMSLRKLASDSPSIEKLRLWGKVLGTTGDYYVAEGVLQSIPKAPDAAPPVPALPDSPEYDVEPRGDGANSFTYWVTSGGSAPWVRLPAARASHVVAARSIKKMLTGSLDSPVHSMPWFPGKERHLLRAQIARISATCNLAARGWYDLDEEAGENKIKESEDPTGSFPGPEEMATEAGWVHSSPCIFKTGKCSFLDVGSLPDGLVTEEQSAAWGAEIDAQKEEEGDDIKPILSDIAGDLASMKPDGEEGNIAWSIKVFGDKGVYKMGDADKTHQVAAVRSMIWPGATAVAQGVKFANIYIGYGLKCGSLVPSNAQSGLPLANTSPFAPLVPDDIMDEPNDLEEQDEPNPGEDDQVSEGGSVDEGEPE